MPDIHIVLLLFIEFKSFFVYARLKRRARNPIGNGVAPFMAKSAKATPHTHTSLNN
jgi:hypothetical protein